MVDASLVLEWSQTSARYVYWYGATRTRFSAQIGHSTNPGLFVWMIFQTDFRGTVWGGEVATEGEAKAGAQEWLEVQAKPPADWGAVGNAEPGAAADTPKAGCG